MGKPFYIKADDRVTGMVFLCCAVRFRPGLSSVRDLSDMSLQDLAKRVATLPITNHGYYVDFDKGRIDTDGGRALTDANVLTSNTDIKNLMMIACEEAGIPRKRFRRNWTLLRRHVSAIMEAGK